MTKAAYTYAHITETAEKEIRSLMTEARGEATMEEKFRKQHYATGVYLAWRAIAAFDYEPEDAERFKGMLSTVS
jgi:hypothetical protein